ncbi:hypothetical protein CDD82_7190 [Ophiocordyceps australis]|uniref:Uncharacterized protein n=1 Tax=Ophiocordyceps australis TaxID=1399860 RepID=A0A2C5ZQD2_9HYPO|nr:hypothetical protein CDD82_7190 [Ophiocordyceps australis]
MAAALSDQDIEKLFSGAPQYFARSESHFYGAPHPSVAFPFDEELEIRDLTDHVQMEDRAWSAVTAWPHLARDVARDGPAKRLAEEGQRAHFHIRCRERPNMLSMQGLERGTMGYQAALELPTADALEEAQFGFESLGTKAQAIVQAREHILSSHGLLHRLPEPALLDRLKRNGDTYRNNHLHTTSSADSHQDLFGDLLRPSPLVIDKADPKGLSNQIVALLKCLGTPNVWIDLSRIEWRIRLGQVLWGDDDGDEVDDATPLHDAHHDSQRAEERYWLLMQVLMATELLLRLDAITEGIEYGSRGIKAIDVAYFERGATQTVKWSLFLARSWLENIDITQGDEPPTTQTGLSRRAPNWLASLVYKLPIGRHKHAGAGCGPYHIKGRQGQRQIDGLIHFARKIQWPGLEAYADRISEKAHHAVESPSCRKDSSANSADAPKQTMSCLGAWDVTGHGGRRRPAAQTPRRRLAAVLHESGWITKSYVFGLVLPGEAMSHFLMATLLENDAQALARLGCLANLSGGFVYAERSFWSTCCIVGRVLAAGEGSSECMGWVSTTVRPAEMEVGWIGIQVEDVTEDMAHLGKKARLWGKKKIERQSSILGDLSDEDVLPVDFIVPHENRYAKAPASVEVELLSLHLATPAGWAAARPPSDVAATLSATLSGSAARAPELSSYPASVRFWIRIAGVTEGEFVYALKYDISFVTAHPCVPSHRVKMLKSATSPTIEKIDVSGSDVLGKGSRSASRIGHPLHRYYKYTVIHLSELIQKPRRTLAELLLDASRGNDAANNGVLVVDCITSMGGVAQVPSLERITSSSSTQSFQHKGSASATARLSDDWQRRQVGSDMEVLVRAICAQRGWNAILSRKRRGCLACAIREAGALGWKVIVRVE